MTALAIVGFVLLWALFIGELFVQLGKRMAARVLR